MPTRVLVVDDSPLARAMLRRILEVDGDLVVVGEAADGAEALKKVEELRPDLATIDLAMPGVDGLEAIERIMATRPIPILVVTAEPERGFQAIQRGALEVCKKPKPEEAGELRTKVRRLATIPVVRHVAGSLRDTMPLPPLDGEGRPLTPVTPRGERRRIVAIAASAGGPGAVARVLSDLPATLDACVAVVQHLPSGYAERFARYLAENTALRVVVADAPTRAAPGTVIVAPDDRHLVATFGNTFGPGPADEGPHEGHRPSATVLFRSIARWYGSAAIGVVLSGIGQDGAAGLAELRARGALTYAQDEATSAVYGMPRAAKESGAAIHVLPLAQLGPAIIRGVAPIKLRPPP
jgi:two-component system chemotaxis response regulator CheB